MVADGMIQIVSPRLQTLELLQLSTLIVSTTQSIASAIESATNQMQSQSASRPSGNNASHHHNQSRSSAAALKAQARQQITPQQTAAAQPSFSQARSIFAIKASSDSNPVIHTSNDTDNGIQTTGMQIFSSYRLSSRNERPGDSNVNGQHTSLPGGRSNATSGEGVIKGKAPGGKEDTYQDFLRVFGGSNNSSSRNPTELDRVAADNFNGMSSRQGDHSLPTVDACAFLRRCAGSRVILPDTISCLSDVVMSLLTPLPLVN